MIRKIVASGFFVACSVTAFSQDDSTKSEESKGTFSIHGSMDTYYKYDFSKKSSNSLTSFTQTHNQFQLGMASATFEYSTQKTHVVLDLGFGKRAQDFSYNDKGIMQAVKQAYISYTPTNNLTLTAGSWATHIGYELVDAYQNRNYSMSYMFSTGPFSHTGIKADYKIGKSNFMIGIANPTDYKYVPDSLINKKFLIAQYNYNAGDKFNLYINYVGGEWVDTSKIHQFDIDLLSHFNSHFWAGIDGTVGLKKLWNNDSYSNNKTWFGAALYLNEDVNNNFGLTLREEYFNDKNGITAIPIDGNVWATTLSFNLKAGNFTLIPEFRFDAASKPIFQKSNGSATKNNASLLLAMTYHF